MTTINGIEYEMNTIAEGICKHRNADDDFEWKVVERNGLAIVLRNQGNHDRRFFVIDVLPTEKALAKAKRLFA